MTFVLDTNICIYLLNGNKNLEKKIADTGVYSIAITHTVLSPDGHGGTNVAVPQRSNFLSFECNITTMIQQPSTFR